MRTPNSSAGRHSHGPVAAVLVVLAFLATAPAIAQPAPSRVTLRFEDAYIIHAPESGAFQIIAQSNVLSYGDGWSIRRLKPYLFHFRYAEWERFFWVVNTSRQEIYRVTDGRFGRLGGDYQTLDTTVRVVGEGESPERFLIDLPDAYLRYRPPTEEIEIGGLGAVFSKGAGWEARRVAEGEYHIRKTTWRGFYFRVDTSERLLTRVRSGRFDAPASGGERLPADVEVTPGREEEKDAVAVLDLTTDSAASDTLTRIALEIEVGVRRAGAFRLIPRAWWRRSITARDPGLQDCEDRRCRLRLGRAIGADRIIVGDVSANGGGVELTLLLVDVESGDIVESFYDEFEGLRETLQEAARAASSLDGRRLVFLRDSALPEFQSWPPATPSAHQDITDELMAAVAPEGGSGRPTFGRVSDQIVEALEDTGYTDVSFYRIPTGVAVVTRLEQIDEDGVPLGDDERWSLMPARPQIRSLRDVIRALFSADPGYFRLIIFAFTSDPDLTPEESSAGESLASEDALDWLQSGGAFLPSSTRNESFTDDHRCIALIYEFERYRIRETADLLDPSRLPGRVHLERSRILARLGGTE